MDKTEVFEIDGCSRFYASARSHKGGCKCLSEHMWVLSGVSKKAILVFCQIVAVRILCTLGCFVFFLSLFHRIPGVKLSRLIKLLMNHL